MNRLVALLLVIFTCVISSCEKAEQPVNLPQRGTSIYAEPVHMGAGPDYPDQIFFDLNTNKVVFTSLINSWDLAFETSPSGYHVFINTAKYKLYNTHQQDIKQVTDAPKIQYKEWQIDKSCGLPDSTAIGEWRNTNGSSKNDVYVLWLDTSSIRPAYMKLQVVSVDADSYTIIFGDLKGTSTETATIPKEPQYNLSYYSFFDGVIFPEPTKETWDIVFTRYSTFFDNAGIFYSLVGVLLNPYKTTGVLVDSNIDFNKVDIHALDSLKLTHHRDAIGWNWKKHVLSEMKYYVNPKKVYVVRDRNDYYWKLHFIDYYDQEGNSGSPSFEYERLK